MYDFWQRLKTEVLTGCISRVGFIKEKFNWQWFYYSLTNEVTCSVYIYWSVCTFCVRVVVCVSSVCVRPYLWCWWF